MGRYVIRRLLQFIPTVLGAMFLLHYLTVLGIQLSGDPVRAMFGDRQPNEAQLEALRRVLGLNDACLNRDGDPCFGLFWSRLQNIFLHFDFGVNQNREEVTELVSRALPHTAKLAIAAFLIEVVLGLLAGVLAGLRNGSFWDYLVKISTVLLISIPVFILGTMVQSFVALPLTQTLREQAWAPLWLAEGLTRPTYSAVNWPWLSLFFPAFVLASLSLATTARLTRTALMENMRADFVRTAKAKGLTNKRVVGVHTMRNSLIPVITYLGTDIAALLSGAVITETIFNVPGIGRLVTNAARSGQTYVVLGVVTMLVLFVMLANLIVDIMYAVLDPRIRYE